MKKQLVKRLLSLSLIAFLFGGFGHQGYNLTNDTDANNPLVKTPDWYHSVDPTVKTPDWYHSVNPTVKTPDWYH